MKRCVFLWMPFVMACTGGLGVPPGFLPSHHYWGYVRYETHTTQPGLLYCMNAWTGCKAIFTGLGLQLTPNIAVTQEVNLYPGYPIRFGIPDIHLFSSRFPWSVSVRISSTLPFLWAIQHHTYARGEIGVSYTKSTVGNLRISMDVIEFSTKTRRQQPVMLGRETGFSFSIHPAWSWREVQLFLQIRYAIRDYTYRTYPSQHHNDLMLQLGMMFQGG